MKSVKSFEPNAMPCEPRWRHGTDAARTAGHVGSPYRDEFGTETESVRRRVRSILGTDNFAITLMSQPDQRDPAKLCRTFVVWEVDDEERTLRDSHTTAVTLDPEAATPRSAPPRSQNCRNH